MPHYRLHSLHIQAASDHPGVERMLHRTLRYKGAEAIPAADGADLMLDVSAEREGFFRSEKAWQVGSSEHGDVGVWKTPDRMILRHGDTRVHLHPEDGTAQAALAPDVIDGPPSQQPPPLFYLITLSLVILLRYRGWYALHAAALAHEERGVLFVAQSESGKSTATLTLARNGWRPLSDDTVLLRAGSDSIQMYSFRRDLCVTPETASHFPELNGRKWPTSLSDTAKWQVDPEQIYSGQSEAVCTPRLLVFPEIVDAPHSHIEPVSPKTALTQLINQGAFFLIPDSEVASCHLTVFRRLINQSHVYRLHAGRDVLEEPDTLHTLLAPLLRRDVPTT